MSKDYLFQKYETTICKTVGYAVNRILKRNPHLERQELFNIGLTAAWKALDAWDENKGKLTVYLTPRAYGAILDFLREIDIVPRCDRRWFKKIQKFKESKEPEPTIVEICEHFNLKKSDVDRILNPRTQNSLDHVTIDVDTYEPILYKNSLTDKRYSLDQNIVDMDTLRILLKGVNKRDRVIFIEHVLHGKTLTEIGKDLGLTRSGILFIYKKTVAHMVSRRKELSEVHGLH